MSAALLCEEKIVEQTAFTTRKKIPRTTRRPFAVSTAFQHFNDMRRTRINRIDASRPLLFLLLQKRFQLLHVLFYAFCDHRIRFRLRLISGLRELLHIGERFVQALLNQLSGFR
jgi:hypothetical protein